MEDYYPGGLTFNSYKRSYSAAQNYLNQGKERQPDLGWDDFGARFYDPTILRWLAVDPHADRYVDYTPYNYVYNNFPNAVDLDGRDGIVIVFPNYKVDTESFLGKQPLGHAGVLLIDNKTGLTKYYEYGRYRTEDGTKGRVRNVTVSNVVIGPDGKPTSKSLNKVLAQISKKSGQGGKIEGAYIESDNFDAMNDYAQSLLNESTYGNEDYDENREPYNLFNNNCGTFACDVVNQDEDVNDKSPSVLDPRPNSIIGEYQDVYDKVTYDPETGTTSYSVNKKYWQQILDMFNNNDDEDN
jgi:RHS repeat-associated protein